MFSLSGEGTLFVLSGSCREDLFLQHHGGGFAPQCLFQRELRAILG